MKNDLVESLKKKYKGKKILIVGLGIQGGGEGIARFFAKLGAKVTVTDKKPREKLLSSVNKLSDLPITFHLGAHDIKDFIDSDIIFKGPSVLWSTPEIVAAKKNRIPIEMEMAFFAKHFEGKIIGITGTRGKSTTTYLIFNILKFSNFPVYLGGGIPGISTIDYLNTLNKSDWVVMELSSWALSAFHQDKISPHIAVLTNIYPDHLNYYNNMEEYEYDKKAIYLYQKEDDYLIINDRLQITDFLKSKVIRFNKRDFLYNLKYLKGDHNLENAVAALQVAKILKIDEKKAVEIISNFKGLPYRQEIVGEKEGIIFVNDTTSTTPIATIKAIASFKDKKIILILGGNSKNLATSQLINNLIKVEKIVLLAGSFTDEILPILKEKYQNKITKLVYSDLKGAIDEAYQLAKTIGKKNTLVLFSPGATSFSMFNNEFHRGEEFNKIVKNLIFND